MEGARTARLFISWRHANCLLIYISSKNGSIVCKELLGIDGDGNPVPSVRDSGFYQKRPCRQYVRDAAEILEKTLGIKED